MGPWLTKQVVTRHWGNVLQDLPAQLRGQVLATLLVDKRKVSQQQQAAAAAAQCLPVICLLLLPHCLCAPARSLARSSGCSRF
jgi:hypothetical protein